MSVPAATVVLWAVVAVFVVSMVDILLLPDCEVVPMTLAKIATAIVSGVAIGVILAGMRSRGGSRGE